MIFFRNFTVPLWQIFGGNLLILATIGFYIAWWTVTFRPNNKGRAPGGGFFIVPALFAGAAGFWILFSGLGSLPQTGKGFQSVSFLLGAVAFYIILLIVTRFAFQRSVTAESLLISLWAAQEGLAIGVLHGNSRLSMAQALILALLVVLATGAGIVCYILHYRLDETARFWNGLIPLIVDTGVVIVFLAVLALS